MVIDANQAGKRMSCSLGVLWTEVPSSYVVQFIGRFNNHPAHQLTESRPLREYIGWLDSEGSSSWDVILVVPSERARIRNTTRHRRFSGCGSEAKGGHGKRRPRHSTQQAPCSFPRTRKSRFVRRRNPKGRRPISGETESTGTNIPDHAYRAERKHPLLMLHLLDCRLSR